ncbi:MAG TPA: metallophosphoesterase family protein [Anaeromyxobacteraceae bacterium]|nr:metallophosphoesterase family protein [Anaeromyxobacteraceae bacterium]
MRVGLVADTHGLFDPKLGEVFRGCDLLLHAGDVTQSSIVEALAQVAPVRAVRGNNDEGPFGESLPEVLRVELGDLRALVVHEARPDRPGPRLAKVLDARTVDLVVHGHSHRPSASLQGRVLFLNPGSAGPRRFALPRTVCVLAVEGRRVTARWWDLATPRARPFGDPFAAAL